MRNNILEEDIKFILSSELDWQSLKNKSILITGSTGFLASYIVDVLLYLNEVCNYNINIILLVRDKNKLDKRFPYVKDKNSFKIIIQDLTANELNIEDPIDIIIHAASNATPKLFGKDPVGTILPNILGTKNLLELATKNNVECFFYFSTSGVYGHVEENQYPIKENSFGGLNSMDVASCYLESKRMAETLCSSWMYQYGTPIKVVRPAITYGAGIEENDGRSFADFIWSIVKDKNIVLYSEGLVLRNFCYIADAVNGFFHILFKGEKGEAYNIASELDISIRDLAQKLVNDVFPEKKLSVDFKYDKNKDFLRKQFDRTTVDTNKAKKLGWEMKFSLEEGFKRSVIASKIINKIKDK